MNHALRQTAYAVIAAAGVLALSALPAAAIDINNLPDWVRDSIHPVEIDWSQVYPGLAAPPAWAQEAAGLQEVRPRPLAGLETVSPAAGPSGVGTLTPLHPASAAGGLQPVSGGSMVAQVNRLSTVDAQPQQLLLTWRSELEAGAIDRDALLTRTIEEQVPAETLVAILELLPLAHPMDPLYFPVCGALWDALDEDLEACLKLPYATRIYMATYLGVLERPDDTKALVNSLENPDPMALGADIYHVSNQLADHEQKSELVAIWAWKKGATLRGPADQAFVSRHILRTCGQLGSRQTARAELLPWAEASLERPGSDAHWDDAIAALVTGYGWCEGIEKALTRGAYWLQAATARGFAGGQLPQAKLRMAATLACTDRFGESAAILREVIADGPPVSAQMAQGQLLQLAQRRPELGDVTVLPPEVWTVQPAVVELIVGHDTAAHAVVRCEGSASLVIDRVASDLDDIELRLRGPSPLVSGGHVYMIDVSAKPGGSRGGVHAGHILVSTNRQTERLLALPIRVAPDGR